MVKLQCPRVTVIATDRAAATCLPYEDLLDGSAATRHSLAVAAHAPIPAAALPSVPRLAVPRASSGHEELSGLPSCAHPPPCFHPLGLQSVALEPVPDR